MIKIKGVTGDSSSKGFLACSCVSSSQKLELQREAVEAISVSGTALPAANYLNLSR